MQTSLPKLILSFSFYLSLVRGTNIALFYPADEAQLGTIDFTLQTVTNAILLLCVTAYFFLSNNYSFFAKAFSKSLVALTFLGVISTLVFSIDFIQSLKFTIAVLAISLPSVLYLHANGIETLLRAFGRFVVVMAFTNLLYIIAMPQYGIMIGDHMGRWRGLMDHKNNFGPFFAIGFFILLHQLQTKNPVYLALQLVSMLISILFIIKAQSSTGLVMFFAMGFFYVSMLFVYRLRTAWERVAVLLLAGSSIIFLYVFAGNALSNLLFELTGKDATLTGRTGIWKILLELIAERPLVGYGPGMSERPEFMLPVLNELSWGAKGTHNSFLDLLVNYGYPVTFLLSFIILKGWLGSVHVNAQTKTDVKNLALASSFIFIILIMGFATASTLFSRSVFSIFMIMGLAIISRLNQERQLK